MTTEHHAWASAQTATIARQLLSTCGCGQDLDVCTGNHCPRCGTSLIGHAA
jgi:hypothetical protein